ncbi:MAG: NAD(P)-dependent oxidoreductase [Parcubacteria group bacterium]
MNEIQAIPQKILVSGGAGYIGSSFIRDALAANYHVRCLDLLIYGGKALKGFISHPNFEFIRGDIRDAALLERILPGMDSVVHLAAIVGDKPCKAAPNSAVEINFGGTKILAEKAKQAGVKRFVFSSTCSNYGIVNPEKAAKEDDQLNPVSLYAETKIDCERFLTGICDEQFATTCLRFGTAYGVSNRTRFDLLVNSFAYEAWTRKEIVAFAANTWRPYIHVADMGLLIKAILEAPIEKVRGEIFNAGNNSANFIKRDVVEILKTIMPELKATYIDSVDDKRDYKVNFDKLEQTIGFKLTKTVEHGFKELLNCFHSGLLTEADFENNKLDTLEKFFGDRENELQKKITFNNNN